TRTQFLLYVLDLNGDEAVVAGGRVGGGDRRRLGRLRELDPLLDRRRRPGLLRRHGDVAVPAGGGVGGGRVVGQEAEDGVARRGPGPQRGGDRRVVRRADGVLHHRARRGGVVELDHLPQGVGLRHRVVDRDGAGGRRGADGRVHRRADVAQRHVVHQRPGQPVAGDG